MRYGTGIDDPVVLTIIESIHHHLRRSLPAVVATMVAITAMAVALVEAAGSGVSFWVPAVSVIVAGGAIAGHRWVINRAGVVIDRSRQH
jgi:integral membrane sensor domain MASE1